MNKQEIRDAHIKFIAIVLTFIFLCVLSTIIAMASEPTPPAASPSAIEGAFSSLMGESFKTDLATGSSTLGIPIVVPPGRKNVQPNVSLSYSSGNSNGICGVGWAIPVSAIQRSTKEGVPRYSSLEGFVAGGEELVAIGGGEYRAKIEASFTKYEYDSINKTWIARDKSGTRYYFGSTAASRMTHPTNSDYIFAWYVDKVMDVYGNAVTYSYIEEDSSVYLKYIDYTSNDQCSPALSADKRIEFVYESAERPDPIYSNRTGWPTAIKKRLEKIKISIDSGIVWIYNLSYTVSGDTSRSLLQSVQLEDGQGNTLPAKTFTYQTLE